MPSAPPFAGASARRQARQLQHLPFRARPLHRSHAASILLFRFHRGNTLSFRSTLDRSHGDCSRSAARPTDCLIFSPRFFFFSRRRAPIPSSRYTRWPPIVPAPTTVSCRLGFASLHQGSSHAGRAALGASTAMLPSALQIFVRSVGRAQCPHGCTGLNRRATISRFHDSPCLVAKAQPVSAVSSTATGRWLTIRPSAAHPPQRFSAAAVPLRTARQRQVPRTR